MLEEYFPDIDLIKVNKKNWQMQIIVIDPVTGFFLFFFFLLY